MSTAYEEIRAPSSMEGSEGLLAIIIRDDYIPSSDGVQFVTPPESSQQLGILSHRAGKVIEPHVHVPAERIIHDTQEVLLIKWGIVVIMFYTSDGLLITSRTLYKGDLVHLISGAHSLRMETDALILEIKSGPYMGNKDKRLITPI